MDDHGRVLLDDELGLDYGFFHLFADVDDRPETGSSFAPPQANGLCGATLPGTLSFTTGLHTGAMPLLVTWSDARPPALDDAWPDVVEVSYTPTAAHQVLVAFEDALEFELPRCTPLRVRFASSDFAGGTDQDTAWPEPSVERCRIDLWPQPDWQPDEVLRCSGPEAQYWHDVARGERTD